MAKFTIIVIYFIASVFATDSYKILGIFPSYERNNHLTYRELFRELANRNNEVTLISHFQLSDPPASYKDVLLSDKQSIAGLSYESVVVNEVSRLPFETLVTTKSGNDDCKNLMNNHHVLHMLRTRPKFDVVIVESYNSDCAIALAANLSAPYIAFNPQPIKPWQFSRLGITFNSAYVPQAGLPYGKEPWFFERLKSYVLYHITNWVYYVGSQVTDHVFLYKYLGDELPSMERLAANASLVLVNTHQSLFGGVPRADNVIDVGGIHVQPLKPIPSDIERFINEAEHGVIYVNLGSAVKETTMPVEKLQAFLQTFSRLPLRVLWKWDGADIDWPTNVMTMRWLPQYDILKHPNIKAFVSHCGILSTIEAVDAGVPVIGIPLFGDQYGNAAVLQNAGVGTILLYQDLKREYLLDALNEVLDPKIQHRAKQVSKLWHDRPMSPLETAIYWTEYVARYQGAPNLQANSVFVPLYQLLQIDVMAFVALVVYILSYVFWKIFTVVCCCCFKNDAESQSQVVYSEERRSKRVKFE